MQTNHTLGEVVQEEEVQLDRAALEVFRGEDVGVILMAFIHHLRH